MGGIIIVLDRNSDSFFILSGRFLFGRIFALYHFSDNQKRTTIIKPARIKLCSSEKVENFATISRKIVKIPSISSPQRFIV
jgi:hypothetical protein